MTFDRRLGAEILIDLLAEAAHADPGSEVRPLRRALSAINLVGLGIGGIIGAGIFVLTGHAAAANAGPAVTLSFLLGAVACAFAGPLLCRDVLDACRSAAAPTPMPMRRWAN